MSSNFKENAYFLNYLIEYLPYFIFWKDKDLVFKGCNQKFAEQFGYSSPEEIIGKTDYDFSWSTQLRDKYIADDKAILSSGKAKLDYEEEQRQPDGSIKTMLVSKVPIYNKKNTRMGILGIYTDISNRKKAEQSLREALDKAEVANQAKTEFLENMRHDIRTPLSGIVGFANLLKNVDSIEKAHEYADNMIASSNSLLEFLNEVLDAITVASGEIPHVKKKFDLKARLLSVINLNQAKAAEKSLQLSLNYSKKAPQYFLGDPIRLQRIFLELVNNALNFTNNGKVQTSVELVEKRNRQIVIKLIVQDTGIGIPLDKQDEIFTRFKRLTPHSKEFIKVLV